jgi:chitinase
VSNQAHVAGDVVSCNGDKWTASQWNYDEAPGGPAGAWNNDGPC